MKQVVFFAAITLAWLMPAQAQEIEKHAPQGFDSLQTNIPH